MSAPLQIKIDTLNFEVEKSLRYHHRRREHYERLHKFVMFGVIFLGSATVASFLGPPEMFGLFTALLGALDLVFGFSHRARDHELLYRRFTELAVDTQTVREPDEERYTEWHRRLLQIEADEPPTYWALEASCYNEVSAAWGRDKEYGLVPLTTWQRLLMNWLTFSWVEFPPPRQRPLSGTTPPPSAPTVNPQNHARSHG